MPLKSVLIGSALALSAASLCAAEPVDAPSNRAAVGEPGPSQKIKHLLYVTEPGIRDDLQYGGAGILVFDIDHDHRFIRRIETPASRVAKPENIKGICAAAATGRLYLSTLSRLCCLDLKTDKPVWEKSPPGGCDRMSITPDGKTLFVPSLEGAFWNLIDGTTGDVVGKIEAKSGAHNTVCSLDGSRVYCAGLKSPLLTVVDTESRKAVGTVGPFSAAIRPFTVNAEKTLCFATVNGLLGFEIGDLNSGKMIHRVEVHGFKTGPVTRHGCPSHGVGLSPDEREVWVCDSFDRQLHVFDATVMPPRQVASVAVRDEPGWVTFSIDGRFAYPSTGEVIDTRTKKVVTGLEDEKGRKVESEKLLEIDFQGDSVARVGDQFGVGRRGKGEVGLRDLKKFTSKEGRFSVEFPGNPELVERNAQTAAGKTTFHMFDLQAGPIEYTVGYRDHPEEYRKVLEKNINEMLDSARDGYGDATHCRLIKESKLIHNKWPGREWKFEGISPAHEDIRCRCYLVGTRQYTISIVWEKGKKPPEEIIAEFLNSLAISAE
jgi:hypothetical protein